MKKQLRTVALLALSGMAVGAAILGAGMMGYANSAFVSSAVAQPSSLEGHNTAIPIDIVADQLEVRQAESRAVFKGAVEASQGELQLFADMLTVFYKDNQAGGDPTIARIDASGRVRIVSPSESAEGDWGVYDVSARLLTLGGEVLMRRGDSELRGERLEIDLETGVTRFDGADVSGDSPGRVRGRFRVPEKENTNPENN